MRTVVSDESLDIPHYVCIALLSCCSHGGQAPVLNSIVCCSWLGVEDERYGEERLEREWASASASTTNPKEHLEQYKSSDWGAKIVITRGEKSISALGSKS
jgi:hypothetical protein